MKCNAKCKYEENGECILNPDKIKLVTKTYDDDYSKQLLQCVSQDLEDRDIGMR